MEEASTLQIGSVAFPPGQCCTSPQLHPCHRLFDRRYETIEEMKEAVSKVIDTLTQEDFHGAFQKLLERYNNALQLEEITSKGTRVSCGYYQ